MDDKVDYAADHGPGQAKSEAVEFLELLRPGGPWVLTAIIPDGVATTITAYDERDVLAFLQTNDGQKNIYYSVNPTRTALTKKAAKTDIAAIEYALGDLDPKDDETPEAAKARYLEQLSEQPKPTAIVDTGNGLQCLFKLATPIVLAAPLAGDGKLKFSTEDQAKIDDIEARIKAVMLRLNSPAGTQNIDRIFRLPGTTNLPNEAKRRKGRVPCATRLLHFNGATHTVNAFPLPETPPRPAGQRRRSLGILPQELRLMLHLQGGTPADYPSRSELFWAFVNAAMRHGIDDDKVVETCLDETYSGNSIYEHVIENGGRDYVKKQIERIVNEPVGAKKERRLIRIKGGGLHMEWRAVEEALVAAKLPVYVRGGVLVQPLWRWEDAR